ncbi:MAG TPA: CBS domain-containing protein [Dongiaceae bacterium]|nr:CBS domain-containing protein [Dongiaceae bacterium]
MTVRNILKNKGAAVVTAKRDETLHRIAQLIAQHRIGAVVMVADDGAPVGIVSERDIVNALAAFGASVLDMPAGQVMSRGLLTCTLDQTADELLGTMTMSRVRHLPVVEGGRLLGIVSIGDVVKLKLDDAAAEVGMLREYVMAGR